MLKTIIYKSDKGVVATMDDTGKDVCEISEDEVYRIITTRNDYRFLTAATIKEEIHKCFTDFAYRMKKALY